MVFNKETPSSPLLFIVVLSQLMHFAIKQKELKLYVMGGMKVESHLTFADDVVFFNRASMKSMKKPNEILEEFSLFFDLAINTQTSFVVFSA